MAKRKPKPRTNTEVIRCDYCKHNSGENKRFGYMWHCSLLNHCVVFGQRYCQAKKQMKGEFEKDKEKYRIWLNKLADKPFDKVADLFLPFIS